VKPRLGVGLPDETERTQLKLQFDGIRYFRSIPNSIRLRAGTRGDCRLGEDNEQCKSRARAELDHGDMTGLDLTFRDVVSGWLPARAFGAECEEIALVAHPLDRCGFCSDEFRHPH
jgi:hypothetical protein